VVGLANQVQQAQLAASCPCAATGPLRQSRVDPLKTQRAEVTAILLALAFEESVERKELASFQRKLPCRLVLQPEEQTSGSSEFLAYHFRHLSTLHDAPNIAEPGSNAPLLWLPSSAAAPWPAVAEPKAHSNASELSASAFPEEPAVAFLGPCCSGPHALCHQGPKLQRHPWRQPSELLCQSTLLRLQPKALNSPNWAQKATLGAPAPSGKAVLFVWRLGIRAAELCTQPSSRLRRPVHIFSESPSLRGSALAASADPLVP